MTKLIKKYVHIVKKQLKKSASRSARDLDAAAGYILKGKRFFIRPAKQADGFELEKMHERLSRQSLYFRYLYPHKPVAKDLERMCTLPGSDGAVFVVEYDDAEHRIVGYACYQNGHDSFNRTPELAILVEDGFQGCGIGAALMHHLCRFAVAKGLNTIIASIHPDNSSMVHLLQALPYQVEMQTRDSVIEAQIHLRSDKNRLSNRGCVADPFAALDLGLAS